MSFPGRHRHTAISISISLIGFSAVISQIVFIRELLIVFYGNELSVSFILGAWLVGGFIGSAVFGRFADRLKTALDAFCACQVLAGGLLVLDMLLIRSARYLIGANPGELIPFSTMVSSSFLLLVPVSAVFGFMFALGCRIYESEIDTGAFRIGKVYIREALGAIVGGVAASFVLIRVFGSLQIVALLAMALAASAIVLALVSGGGRLTKWVIVCASAILAAQIIAVPSGLWRGLDRYSKFLQWRGYDLLESKNSKYGNIAVTREGTQISFFDNGLHLYTVPDRQASEEAVHFAMLEHRDPRKILLIGGGVGGLVGEILRHPVDRVDYVELDPLILRMAKDNLPNIYYEALKDERVRLIHEDGRLFVKTAGGAYDVIIVSVGDPYTAQINRFYTVEFFSEAGRILKKGGVLSFGLGSSESYMSRELREFLGSIYTTLAMSFDDVKIIPGETAHFLASDAKGVLTYDYKVLMSRASERSVDLKYVREYYLASRMSRQNIAFAESSITGVAGKINRDMHPVSYYYDMVFWAARFKNSLVTRALRFMDARRVLTAAFFAVIFVVFFARVKTGRGDPARRPVISSVAVNGFSQVVFQIVTLVAFQIIYGYVFYKVGIIITAFMAGLALGGMLAVRRLRVLGDQYGRIILLQAGLCVYSVLLPLTFHIIPSWSSGPGRWIGSNVVFVALPLAAGLIGGYIFPLANKILLGDSEHVGGSGGFVYGIDLLGSCIGALVTGVFLVPILGITATCLVVSAINASVLFGLAVSKR